MPGMQQTLHCAEEGGMWNKFHCHCFCGNKFRWRSQPFSYRLPLENLVLAAAAFFTACSPTRLLNVFVHANIAYFRPQTFNNLQASCLVLSIRRGVRDTSLAPGGDRTLNWLETGGAIHQATVPSMEATL